MTTWLSTSVKSSPEGAGPKDAQVRRWTRSPDGVRSKAVTRLPKVSFTSSTCAVVITLPLGNQRSEATSVTLPSGSTRCRDAGATLSPEARSKPKLPT